MSDSFLKLRNADGKRAIDLAWPGSEQYNILNTAMRPDIDMGAAPGIEGYKQNVHVQSIHQSVDQSMVRLALTQVPGSTTANSGAKVTLSAGILDGFMDEQLGKLNIRLAILLSLDNTELLVYLKPSLNERQKLLKVTNPEIVKIL